jgi:hypothetical protein
VPGADGVLGWPGAPDGDDGLDTTLVGSDDPAGPESPDLLSPIEPESVLGWP